MARPKKDVPMGDDSPITIGYDSYMRMADFLAKTITQQSEIANRQVQVSSSQYSNAQTLLSQVKLHTQMVITSNERGTSSVSDLQYPNIRRLLTTDNLDAAAGETSLPIYQQMPTNVKTVKQKKVKKPRDPNAPKRPLTAFFLFLKEKRDETTKQLPPDVKPGEVQTRMTDKWNSMAESEQKPYKERYEKDMHRYKAEMADYTARLKAEGANEEVTKDEPADEGGLTPTTPAVAESKETSDEDEEEETTGNAAAAAKETSEEDESSEEDSPPPKKETKKSALKSNKEASPKKKKTAVVDEKKTKKEAAKSASPEAPKKKRKADADEAAKTDKKKKRKSQGYAGNTDDY